MAKDNFKSQGGDAALRSSDVSDQVVSQVGKAAVEILKLRQSLEESLATAQTEDDRETLTSQVEMAAVRAIDEQGLTINQSRRRPPRAQTRNWKSAFCWPARPLDLTIFRGTSMKTSRVRGPRRQPF